MLVFRNCEENLHAMGIKCGASHGFTGANCWSAVHGHQYLRNFVSDLAAH